MEISLRPWLTTGVALVGAGAIAMAPISPLTAAPTVTIPAISAAQTVAVHTTAFELPYILTLPVLRQYIVNQIDYWAIYLSGFAESGIGLLQSIAAIPQTLVTITQQLLQLDFVGAFDTFSTAVTNAVIAVGQPVLDSLIERRQKYLAVQTAMQAAVPQAFFSVLNGVLAASNGVINSVIIGSQDLVGAILTLNLGNIVNAAIDGTVGFVQAVGAGAGDIVTGIEAAQLALTTALQATPAPVAEAAPPSVSAVPDLTKNTVALTVDAPTKSANSSAAATATESDAPAVAAPDTDTTASEPPAVEPKAKRSGAKSSSGAGAAAASKRAAHPAAAAPKKTAAASAKE